MAESQKKEAPAVSSKDKSSLLDIDIDKDFFGSWKSTSAADDGMDFDFGPTTGGTRKAFKFDKMDMDFSLDTDFDKLSSFKIDMPALDISSPIKNSGNSKEKSKELSSGGEHQAKRDAFAFSFDFDDFADLKFDSRKTKIDDKSSKAKDKEEHSNTNDSGGSKNLLAKDIDALKDDDASSKHQASTSAAISKVNAKKDDIKDADPKKTEDHLESVQDESSLPKPANAEEQEIRRTITPKIISCSLEVPIQESDLSEKIPSPEPHAQQTALNLHGHSLAADVSTKGTFPDVQVEEEIKTAVRMASPSSGTEQNGNAQHEMELVPTSSSESLSTDMNSQSQEGEMCKAIDDHVLIGHIDGDAHLKSSMTPEIQKLAHGELFDKNNADSIPEPCTDFLERQNNGTKTNELVPEKERRKVGSYSKYFKRQNESESELKQASLIVNKRMSTLPNNLALEKRESDTESVESGFKITSISRSLPQVLRRAIPVQTENTETDHVKGLDNNRECLNSDNIKTRNETTTTTVAHAIGPTKEELVSRGSNQNTDKANALRSDNPSSSIEKSKKNLSSNCLNPGLQITSMTSTSNPRNIVAKKNVTPPTKAEMRASEASPQEVSRAADPKLKTLHSIIPKGLTSMRNKDQNPEGNMPKKRNPSIDTKKQLPSLTSMRNKEQGLALKGNMVLTRNSSVDTVKHSPSAPTLKRKSYEESAEMPGSIPLKRLSASPCSKNIRALVEKIDDKQKSTMPDDSLIEMDITYVTENDSNFEKAEACSKELEDLCNMLKKKHEEAKDLLVRAIVNNNNLLMLNHPVYKDKISFLNFRRET